MKPAGYDMVWTALDQAELVFSIVPEVPPAEDLNKIEIRARGVTSNDVIGALVRAGLMVTSIPPSNHPDAPRLACYYTVAPLDEDRKRSRVISKFVDLNSAKQQK